MGRTSDAKTRIVESALLLMNERGYSDVGVEEIMQAAGVGKSSFYHFFKSKEELGRAVLAEYHARLAQEMKQNVFSESFDPLERPMRLVKAIIAKLEGQSPIRGCMALTHASTPHNGGDEMLMETNSIFDGIASELRNCFREAILEHDMLPSAPIDELAEACLAYLQGVQVLCKARQSVEPMRKLGPKVAHIWKPYLA